MGSFGRRKKDDQGTQAQSGATPPPAVGSGPSASLADQEEGYQAIENFAQNVAAMQGISGHLRQYGVASMELPLDGTDIPEALLTERGTAGALIGMPAAGRPAQVTTPAGPVDMVPLTIVGTQELAVILGQGQAGRDSVVAARQQDGRGHVTVV